MVILKNTKIKNSIMRYKSLLSVVFCVLIFLSALPAKPANTFQWRVGEELTYSVHWSFFRLGTLKLEVKDSLTYNGHSVYHIRLHIDSNPALFFVDMHSKVDSYIDDDMQLHRFLARENIDNVNYLTEYRLDYEQNKLIINMTDLEDTTHTIYEEKPLTDEIYDGSGLIYLARSRINNKGKLNVTALANGELSDVHLNFTDRTDLLKIDSLPSKVETYYLDGSFDNVGLAGLTGPFKGWFAKDPQAPPLKAKLKVFIGSVSIELENYKKWSPDV
ncbi:MAG: DUF3108 domain-containing protein [Caldithrix sp.]|nr:DUF3108 domain-containing protein [Caldithrix sp.]